MSIPGLQQLLSFFVRYIGKFLGSLFLKDQPLNPILEHVGFLQTIFLDIPSLKHVKPLSDGFSTPSIGWMNNAQRSAGASKSIRVAFSHIDLLVRRL